MKYLACLFFTLLFTHNVLATELCAVSCDLIITFPDGGSIEAVEPLAITFGTGGALNLGEAGTVNKNPQPVSTDFSAGGVLSLAGGESISFGKGGSLYLGDAGNIDYLNMVINSSGGARIAAEGIIDTMVIKTLRITGGIEITIEAGIVTFLSGGALHIDSGSTLIIIADSSSSTPSVCSLEDPVSNLAISTGVTSFDSSEDCTGVINSLGLSADILTVGIIDPNATLSATGSITITPGTFTPIIGTGDLTLQPLTSEFLLTLADGVELPTGDGKICTMSSGECVTSEGVKYTVVDGKLVSAEEGAGQVNLLSLLVLIILQLSSRFLVRIIRGYRYS